jgi:hypothetical protein
MSKASTGIAILDWAIDTLDPIQNPFSIFLIAFAGIGVTKIAEGVKDKKSLENFLDFMGVENPKEIMKEINSKDPERVQSAISEFNKQTQDFNIEEASKGKNPRELQKVFEGVESYFDKISNVKIYTVIPNYEKIKTEALKGMVSDMSIPGASLAPDESSNKGLPPVKNPAYTGK